MKYPKLSEFIRELEKCQEKVKHGTFTQSNEVTRGATIDGHQVQIVLEGKEGRSPQFIIDGIIQYRRGYLRSFYSAHKPEFNELLAQLKEASDKVGDAVKAILEALTSEQVPELVLKRLKGDKIETDPGETTKALAMSKASSLAFNLHPPRTISSFYFNLTTEMYGQDLTIQEDQITWGNIRGATSEGMRHNEASIEDNLLFLNRFSEFKDFVDAVKSHLQTIIGLAVNIAQQTRTK